MLWRMRMVYIGLLESAMRYKEGFFREELERNTEQVLAEFEGHCETNKKNPGYRKRMEPKVRAHIINIEQGVKKFNASIYKEIEDTVKSFPKKSKEDFDNYATGFGIILDEYVRAKNTTELLTVVSLYNQGLLDSVFEQLNKPKSEIILPDNEIKTNDTKIIL